MLSLRLRWYGLETAKVLRRHWQAVALTVMLLLPAMPVFAQASLFGAPILAPLAPEHGIEWRLFCVHAIEAVAVLWVLMQRSAIVGGPFAAFLHSLPAPTWRRRLTDAAVVTLASTPLLLPVAAAFIALAFLPQKGTHYAYLMTLLMLTLGWQLTALARHWRHVPALLLANGVLIAALQTGDALGALLMTVAALIGVAVIARTPARGSTSPIGRRMANGLAVFRRQCRQHLATVPALALPVSLLRQHGGATMSRVIVMTAMVVASLRLSALWEYDARVVPLALIAQAGIALVASAAYRDLRAAHARAAHFMRSLPLSRRVLPTLDVATVTALALPWMCIAPLQLVARHAISPELACAMLLAGVPLLFVLRLPQRYAQRQSVLTAAILAAAWVALTWQCLL